MSALELIRWILAAAIAALWVWIAWFNASCLWRSLVRKQDAPSLVPIVGVFLVIGATAIAPLEPRQRWPFVLAGAVLDPGCVAFVLLAIWGIVRIRLSPRKK